MQLEVVEYTDPLCPWAWGSGPSSGSSGRPGRAGLLAPGLLHPLRRRRRPAARPGRGDRLVRPVRRGDLRAHEGPAGGAAEPGRGELLAPPRSSPKAAEAQGSRIADRVLRRLRETVFVRGEPADTMDAALLAARGVPDLDGDRLRRDAASDAVRERVRGDRAEARDPLPEARRVDSGSPHPGTAKETHDGQLRYALPTLLLRTAAARRIVPGWRPYEEYAGAVEELCPGLLRTGPAALPAAQALRHHRSLGARAAGARRRPPGRRPAPYGWTPREARCGGARRRPASVPRRADPPSVKPAREHRPPTERPLTSDGRPSAE